jgi:hypothetical protein
MIENAAARSALRTDIVPGGLIRGRSGPWDAGVLESTYVGLNALVTFLCESQQRLGFSQDQLVIFLTILSGNLQRWHRSGEMGGGSKQSSAGEVSLVPMSQSAIARSTGIPRETVRRQLRALQQRGVVVVHERGAVTVDFFFAGSFLAQPPVRRLLLGSTKALSGQMAA